MEYHVLGLIVSLICLFHFGRKSVGWAFLVSYIIVALLNLVGKGAFKSGPDVGYNWGVLPEVLASILGPFIVQFGAVYIVYYITSEFVRWVKNEKTVKTSQTLRREERSKKLNDNILTGLGIVAIVIFLGLLIYKVFEASK